MFYILKIDDYSKILIEDQVKDIVAIKFTECFKSTRVKLYSKLNEEQNLKKVTESLYIFLRTPDEVEKYAKMMKSDSSDNCLLCYNVEIFCLFDPELQLINTKSMIKDKLK